MLYALTGTATIDYDYNRAADPMAVETWHAPTDRGRAGDDLPPPNGSGWTCAKLLDCDPENPRASLPNRRGCCERRSHVREDCAWWGPFPRRVSRDTTRASLTGLATDGVRTHINSVLQITLPKITNTQNMSIWSISIV